MTPEIEAPEAAGQRPDDLFFLSLGPFAAILIGMCLVPLRSFTVASNFTLVFVALTIVVAEFGGRRAAFATAVTSTLSLDFFLTEPYLTLAISSKHDVLAFCGLALCGALAAGLGSGRRQRKQALQTARAHLDLLHAGIRETDEEAFTKLGIERLLAAFRDLASLSAAALRDARGQLLASAGDGAARTAPHEALRPQELLVARLGPRILPPEGNRIPLSVGTRLLGSLDVWGDGTPLSVDACRLVGDLAILLGTRLSREGT